MITRRQLVAAGAVASAGALTAACGSGTPGQTAEQEDAEQSGRTTVQFWKSQLTDLEDEWYEKVVEQFNQSQSEVQVVLTQVPGDAWEQKLKAAQAAGKAPDMYIGVGNNVAVQVRNGELADLTDLLPATAWDDLDANAQSLVTVDGQRYAYPMLFEPQTVLYYRKDFFAEAGLDPETPPRSWDDVLTMGPQLAGDGRFALVMGVTQGDFGWQSWGWQRNVAGHLPISDDWSTAQADDPAYERLGQFYRDLYDQQLIPRQSLGAANDSTPFGQGKAAMMVQGSWGISQVLDEFGDLRDQVGVAPLPTWDGNGTVPVTIGNMKWMVDGKSANVEAAVQFLTWAIAGEDPAVLVDYFKVTGYSKFPARTSLSETLAQQPDADTVNPWRRVIAEEVMPDAELEPAYDWQVAEAFGIAMEKSMRGEDVKGALAEANTTIEGLITSLDLPSKAPQA